jgi:hypothetical protein
MNIEKSGEENIVNVEKEAIVSYGKLTIRPAKKVGAKEKPRLYKKVQKTFENIKSSLSNDIIEARNE